MKSLNDYWLEEQYFKLRYELDQMYSLSDTQSYTIEYKDVDDWRLIRL